eukprot:scaffold92811_cov69-Phaeocystis_antarctica.AAC.2
MPFIILLLVPHRTSFPRFPLGHQRHWSLPHSSCDTATLSTAARSCCSRARYQIRVGYARVHELRKLNGKRLMPWLSVRTKDASLCSAVIQPLVLVPLTSLGRRAVAMEASGAQAMLKSLVSGVYQSSWLLVYAHYSTATVDYSHEMQRVAVSPKGTERYVFKSVFQRAKERGGGGGPHPHAGRTRIGWV